MIHGKKVQIRLLEASDLEQIAKWRNQSRVAKWFFNAMPFALSEQERWYQGYLNDPAQRMFIVENLEGGPIGTLALVNIDQRNQSAELGRIVIGEDDYLGNGFCGDAIRALLRFSFNEMNLNRVYAEVLGDNDTALALYERCGFKREGIKRNAIFKAGMFQNISIVAVLREEYFD